MVCGWGSTKQIRPFLRFSLPLSESLSLQEHTEAHTHTQKAKQNTAISTTTKYYPCTLQILYTVPVCLKTTQKVAILPTSQQIRTFKFGFKEKNILLNISCTFILAPWTLINKSFHVHRNHSLPYTGQRQY